MLLNPALLSLWSFLAAFHYVQAAPVTFGRQLAQAIPRSAEEDWSHTARGLGHSIAGDLDSILERRRPYPGVFDPSRIHVLRALLSMSHEVEAACRVRGGTPEVENGHATCSMNPEPFRRPLNHLQHVFSTKHKQPGMSHAEEVQCRERGGTPEMVHGLASCEMNPTPERKILHTSQAVFEFAHGHGRRGWFDDQVDQVDLGLPNYEDL